jgi:pimeloyl-ACP methyl ester carboxylesterase
MTSTSPTLPTVLIIPGAWQTPFHYHLLLPSLQKLGYRVECLSNPSNSKTGPWLASWEEDVLNIRSAIDQEAAAGHEVVLVMHSYGGCPGSEATKEYLVQDFAAKGGEGGVSGLVYMSAMVMPAGTAMPESFQTHPDFLVDVCTTPPTLFLL